MVDSCEEKQAPIQRQQRVSRAAFLWQAGSCRRQKRREGGVIPVRRMSDAALTSEGRAVLVVSRSTMKASIRSGHAYATPEPGLLAQYCG